MPHHELKKCSRCDNDFECRMGSITQCQCYAVPLSEEERQYLSLHFQDCLCASCLLELNELLKQRETKPSAAS